jgi:hypothetical protein
MFVQKSKLVAEILRDETARRQLYDAAWSSDRGQINFNGQTYEVVEVREAADIQPERKEKARA